MLVLEEVAVGRISVSVGDGVNVHWGGRETTIRVLVGAMLFVGAGVETSTTFFSVRGMQAQSASKRRRTDFGFMASLRFLELPSREIAKDYFVLKIILEVMVFLAWMKWLHSIHN